MTIKLVRDSRRSAVGSLLPATPNGLPRTKRDSTQCRSRFSNPVRVIRIGAVLCALIGAIAFSGNAHAQSKVGWVDLDRILNEYEEFRTAEELFRQDAAIWEAEFDSVQEVYFVRVEEYQRQKLLLSEDTRRRRELELGELERNVIQIKMQFEKQAEQRRNELTNPILQRIQEVVEGVATEEDYDYIMNASQIYMTANGLQFAPIMYAKKKLDLTDRVFEELAKLK